MDEAKQIEDEFYGVFAKNSDEPAPAKAEAVTEEVKQDEPKQEEAPTEEAKEEPKAETEELPKIAGFTEEELKNLLANAAKVSELEAAVRKAHGKIGELNGTLQELRKAPAKEEPKPEPKAEIAHVEEDYPDIAAYVREQLEAVKPKAETKVEQPQQAEMPSVDLQFELRVMDHIHKGWREKVQGRDFNLWLGSQTDEIRGKFDSAQTADELNAVIGQFDAWNSAKITRNTTGKQRLEQAMTPEGSAGKPKHAPTEQDEFYAVFNKKNR